MNQTSLESEKYNYTTQVTVSNLFSILCYKFSVVGDIDRQKCCIHCLISNGDNCSLVISHQFGYPQTDNISCTLGNKVVVHSDVVGAVPVGTAPTTSSFSTQHLASIDWAEATARWDEKHLSFWCGLYYRFDGISLYTWYYTVSFLTVSHNWHPMGD